jgi:glycosyltransferase involved in cell wall biosynthesis
MFVGRKGPDRRGVTYLTGVTDTELGELYRRAWVCASPSTYEGFGLPYLEAMACGTAVVATSNAGSREVLGERYGGLVDDADFATALVAVLADAAKRRALELAGLERAADFSMDRMLDQYEALLTEVRGSHARSIVSA